MRTYKPTPLESWVIRFYQKIGVNTHEELDEATICKKLNIFLKRKPRPSFFYENGLFRCITLDSRTSFEEQRESFYHELCHFLRHCGNQTIMPIAFLEMQEWDAHHFTRYAALPYHMITEFELRDPDIIPLLAEKFKITEKLCEERLIRMHKRIESRYLGVI